MSFNDNILYFFNIVTTKYIYTDKTVEKVLLIYMTYRTLKV